MYETSYRNIYHEIENLGDDEGQNKAPEISGGELPVSALLNQDKFEALAQNPSLGTPDIRKFQKTYDFKTKNTSFLELYKDLYMLGVKNNKFFLAIYDRTLIGVDPYSPGLTLEMQLRVFAECQRNPWYWLREVCRIPADGKPIEIGGGVPFRIDRTSVAMWYLFLHHIDQYVCKPRQTGKTQGALAIINYAFLYGARGATVMFTNKDGENNKMNLYRLKCQRDMLPAFMQMRMGISDDGSITKEKNSVTTFQNPVNKNNIKLLPRANSKDSANSCGRGATSAIFYGDEVDFSPYYTTILNSAAFAYATASENAIANHSMAGRIFTSTPGDLDSRDGKDIMEWIDGMLVWSDKMLDWPVAKLKQESTAIARDGSFRRNGIVYVQHTWRQLKKTMSWYLEQCRLVNYDQETVQREIDLKRVHGSSMSPFRREDIMFIQAHVKTKPLQSISFSPSFECPMNFYKKMKRSVPYLICVDPSESLALDNNAVEVLSPYTKEVVAEMQSSYISQEDLCMTIEKFMANVCPNAIIIVENNKGRELINRLRREDGPFRDRVWYDTEKILSVQDKINVYGEHTRSAYENRAYGVNTNGNTRPAMFSILERMMNEEKQKFYTPFVVDDICALIRKPSGKIEAAPQMHDDNIMALLIGLFVLYNASNLEEFGLVKGAFDPDEEDVTGLNFKIKEETRPKTKEEQDLDTLKKLRDMYPNLPPDLQEMLKDSLFSQHIKLPKTREQRIQESFKDNRIAGKLQEVVRDDMSDVARITQEARRQQQSVTTFMDTGELDQNTPYDFVGPDYGLQPEGGMDVEDYLDQLDQQRSQNPGFDINDYI